MVPSPVTANVDCGEAESVDVELPGGVVGLGGALGAPLEQATRKSRMTIEEDSKEGSVWHTSSVIKDSLSGYSV